MVSSLAVQDVQVNNSGSCKSDPAQEACSDERSEKKPVVGLKISQALEAKMDQLFALLNGVL